MKINENIRAARIASGLTQEQVAEKLHTTRQTVSSYETGRTQADIETLCALAELFSVPVNTLLYGDNITGKRKVLFRAALVVAVVTLAVWVAICGACYWVWQNFPEYGATEKIRYDMDQTIGMFRLASHLLFDGAVLVLLYFDLTLPGKGGCGRAVALVLGLMLGQVLIASGWSFYDQDRDLARYLEFPPTSSRVMIYAMITDAAVYTVRRIKARRSVEQAAVKRRQKR